MNFPGTWSCNRSSSRTTNSQQNFRALRWVPELKEAKQRLSLWARLSLSRSFSQSQATLDIATSKSKKSSTTRCSKSIPKTFIFEHFLSLHKICLKILITIGRWHMTSFERFRYDFMESQTTIEFTIWIREKFLIDTSSDWVFRYLHSRKVYFFEPADLAIFIVTDNKLVN